MIVLLLGNNHVDISQIQINQHGEKLDSFSVVYVRSNYGKKFLMKIPKEHFQSYEVTAEPQIENDSSSFIKFDLKNMTQCYSNSI